MKLFYYLYCQYMKFSLILASLVVFCSYAQPIFSRNPHQGNQREKIKQNRGRRVQDDHEKKLIYHRYTQKSQDNQYWEKNKYCAVWKAFRCLKCAETTYWNGKTCVPSNPNCKTFDSKNGCCTSCYGGYVLNSGKCIVAEPQEIDQLCHQFKDGECIQCSYRAYFGKNGQCVNVNPLCKNFHYHDGCCTSCYAGYKLINGGCVIDYKFKRHHSDDHHRSTQRFKKDAPPTYQATIESITVNPSNIVDPAYNVVIPSEMKYPISVDPPVYTVITPPQINNKIAIDPPVYNVFSPSEIKNPIVIDPPVYTVIPPPKENLIRKKFQCSTSQQVRNRKSTQKARH